jgi:uncharacterized membrane protein YphA (DoxX/SURF4 family)
MPASNSKSIRRSASKAAVTAGRPIRSAPVEMSRRAPQPWWRVAWDFLRGPYPTLVSRVILGAVFLLAGVSKALDMNAFAGEINAYQMMPSTLVSPLSIALPLVEILLGVYLLLGLMQRWAAVASGVLLLIFIAAMTQAMARGLTLDCGCFGNTLGLSAFRDSVSVGTIIRDVIWLLLAVHLFFIPGIWTIDALRRKHASA